MHNFVLMLKKELWDCWANSKIVLILALGALLSIAGPYVQSLRNYPVQFSGQLLSELYYLFLPILLLILIPFMMMGTVAGELKNHTAASLLVRPIGRAGYILSKFVVYYFIFALAVMIVILFSAVFANAISFEPIDFSTIWTVLGLMLAFLAFAVALLLFLSTIIKNQLVAGAVGMSLLIAVFTAGKLVAGWTVLLPGKLLLWVWEIVSLTQYPGMTTDNPYWEGYVYAYSWPALFVALISTVVLVVFSILVMRHREL